MSYEDEIPESNRMTIEVSTQDEIDEAVFMDEILAEYDKVYKKIEEGITVSKKLEYMSESGHVWSFVRQEKQLLAVVTPGDREGEVVSKFYYLNNKKMIPTLLINLINKMEMHGQFRYK